MDQTKLKKLFGIISWVALAVAILFIILWSRDKSPLMNRCDYPFIKDNSDRVRMEADCVISASELTDRQGRIALYSLGIFIIAGVSSWLIKEE